MPIKKITLLLLVIVLAFSCSQKQENATDLHEQKKTKKSEFGFLYSQFNVVHDTIQNGDTFGSILEKQNIGDKKVYEIIEKVKTYLVNNFGTVDLRLGDIQKLVRGDKEYPGPGFPDLLSPEWGVPYKDGKRKITGGDAYVALVRFPKQGLPIIETSNTYGASAKIGKPHFDDQVDLFLQQKTKPMTLDKAEVLRTAKRIYHPGE